MSNFYPNNNIENLVFYGNQRQNINHHICFGCILVSIILFMLYDFYQNRKKNRKSKSNNIQSKLGKSCTSCNKNNSQSKKDDNQEEHNNLILKYETENFREIFNKTE